MEEIEAFLQLLAGNTAGPTEGQRRFLHIIFVMLPFLVIFVVVFIATRKKNTTQTTVQDRFIALQKRLIRALELDESFFLNEATEIHKEYKALLEAYQKLYGTEEQKK